MSNIYRIVDETHLCDIIDRNQFKVIVVSFGNKRTNGHILKKSLVELSKKFQQSIFLYVDVDQYTRTGIVKVGGVPTTMIFFNKELTVEITGINPSGLNDVFCDFEQRTRHITNQSTNKQQTVIQTQPINKVTQQTIVQQPTPQDNKSQNTDGCIQTVIDKLETLKKTKETNNVDGKQKVVDDKQKADNVLD